MSVLAVVVASGCAAPSFVQPRAGDAVQTGASVVPGFVGPTGMPELTRAAIDGFPEPLPEGVSWSAAPIHLWRDDPQAAIEDSVPEVGVAEYWLCTWMRDYLGAVDAGDQPRADLAMSQLGKYPSLPAIIADNPNPKAFSASVLQPARMGDTRMLREFFTTCRSLSVAADGTPTLTKMAPTSPDSAQRG